MNLTARHNIDEFIRCLGVPVYRDGEVAEWHEDTCHFVIESHTTHLLLCIITQPSGNASGDEIDAVLQVLYRRAAPQRFMGLPVRVYRNQESIIGALAI